MLDNPFSEEIFPNTQSKPPLAQVEDVFSRVVTCYLQKETDTHLTTTSFQVVIESRKVPSQPPLLRTKQLQLPQPLLITLVLQTPHQPHCPFWTRSRNSVSFLHWGAQNWTQHSRCGLSTAAYRGMITALLLLATLCLIQARMLLAFLATWAHCWLWNY